MTFTLVNPTLLAHADNTADFSGSRMVELGKVCSQVD